MTYEEGHSITDTNFLEKNNIDLNDLAKKFTEIYNTQIFTWGFIQTFPDFKNILLRNEINSEGKKELKIVLFDHACYRYLTENFGDNYIDIYRGVRLQNKEMVKIACNNIGIENVEFFVSLIFNRSYEDLFNEKTLYFTETRLIEACIFYFFYFLANFEEREKIKEYSLDYYKDITKLVNSTDKNIVIILKVNEFLRKFDREHGDVYFTVENAVHFFNLFS